MTPEREKYLDKCGKRELDLRDCISLQKSNLKTYKSDFKDNATRAKQFIKYTKHKLVAYRHELHRLKGMDNVARIKGVWYEDVAESNLGYCKCGNLLIEVGADKKPWDVYCRKCGRKIFWREQ